MSKKLPFALLVYAILAVLAWFTLDAKIPAGGQEFPLRGGTLAIIAFFAVRTLLHAKREHSEQDRDRSQHLG